MLLASKVYSCYINFSLKLAIIYQYFDQYWSPIYHAFIYTFCDTKPSISFTTSKLLYAIGLQSLKLIYNFSLELAIIYQYFDQYLSPSDHAFISVFCATKPSISFITSKLAALQVVLNTFRRVGTSRSVALQLVPL